MNPGSRAQGAIKVWGGLSMNRPLTPSLSPSEGERVPGGRVRGVVHGPNACEKRKGAFHEPPLSRPAATLSPPCGERAGRGETRRGSWPQLTSNLWRCPLPINLTLPEPGTHGRDARATTLWLRLRRAVCIRGWITFHFSFGSKAASGWRRNESRSAMSGTVMPASSPSGIRDFPSAFNSLISFR